MKLTSKEKKVLSKTKCMCGHLFDEHTDSASINYLAGRCKLCTLCKGFIDEKQVLNDNNEIEIQEVCYMIYSNKRKKIFDRYAYKDKEIVLKNLDKLKKKMLSWKEKYGDDFSDDAGMDTLCVIEVKVSFVLPK